MMELLLDPTTVITLCVIFVVFLLDHIRDRASWHQEEDILVIDGAALIQALRQADEVGR